MSLLPPGIPQINVSRVVSVVPTISTSAYTSGDQLGGIMTLTDVIRPNPSNLSGLTELVSIVVLDGSLQNAAMDIWIFNQSPTVTSVDNGAFSMSDANQALQCLGSVSIGVSGTSGAYSASALNSVSSNPNLNLLLEVDFTAEGVPPNPNNLYAIAIVRGTPTYTTTSSLKFLFGFFVD